METYNSVEYVLSELRKIRSMNLLNGDVHFHFFFFPDKSALFTVKVNDRPEHQEYIDMLNDKLSWTNFGYRSQTQEMEYSSIVYSELDHAYDVFLHAMKVFPEMENYQPPHVEALASS